MTLPVAMSPTEDQARGKAILPVATAELEQGYADRLQTLHEIDRAILQAVSPQAIANAAILRLQQLVNCQRISIALFDHDADQALVLAVYDEGSSNLKPGVLFALRANVTEVVLRGEARIIEDMRAIARPTSTEVQLLARGVLSYVSVPLVSRDGIIGCLNLGAGTPLAFSPWHVDIAFEVSNSLAIAIQNARLYEQVQNHAKELEQRVAQRTAELVATLAARQHEFEAISQIAELTVRTMELPGMLSKALEIGIQALGMDLGTLSLLEAHNQELELTAVYCTEADQPTLMQHSALCLKQGLSRLAITAQRPVSLPELTCLIESDTADVHTLYTELSIQSAVAVPVRSKANTIGVMLVMSKQLAEFPQAAIAFLEALTTHIAVLIENSRLRNQSRTLSIMEERRRLASELHDSVTQSLFSLCLAAEGLKAVVTAPNPAALHALGLLLAQAEAIKRELRTLINELRPVDLNQGGLDMALRAHADSLQSTANILVALMLHGDVSDLPWRVQQNLNRITQEALSNIARHSQAAHVEIELRAESDVVCLTIRDDGCGFDPQQVALADTASLGLVSMRERAEMMGGALIVRSAPGAGTVITVKIPVINREADSTDGST